jgi:CRISPR-associated Cas5-like protein
MILLSVRLSFHWGFWARPLFMSARQPTMTVPPPTVFVGALARGLAELLRARGVWVPEYRRAGRQYYVPLAQSLGRCVERVYFRLMRGGVSAAVDKTRVFQGPYIRLENLRDPTQRFAVRDLGKAYAPGAEAEFAALVREGCEVGEGDARISLDAAALVAAAHAVTRLGPAEGVVAVADVAAMRWEDCVEVRDAKVLDMPCPYFPWGGGELPPPWRTTQFLDWRDPRAWSDERIAIDEGGMVAYAVPESAWSTLRVEFPPCLTLLGAVEAIKIVKCGSFVYVDPRL